MRRARVVGVLAVIIGTSALGPGATPAASQDAELAEVARLRKLGGGICVDGGSELKATMLEQNLNEATVVAKALENKVTLSRKLYPEYLGRLAAISVRPNRLGDIDDVIRATRLAESVERMAVLLSDARAGGITRIVEDRRAALDRFRKSSEEKRAVEMFFGSRVNLGEFRPGEVAATTAQVEGLQSQLTTVIRTGLKLLAPRLPEK